MSTDQKPHTALRPWIWGGALLALAGHWELIRRFGTVLPYRDPWQLTGVEILGPWVEGTLGWRDFFQPLNDHWPVLTRLFSFGLVLINDQWNNLLEITLNAVLLAVAIGVLLGGLLRGQTRAARLGLALWAGLVFALPITWENTLWGIQSLPYFQILLSLIYLRGVVAARGLDGGWWVAQAAGVLMMFSQHSAVLAPVAVLPFLAWRWWRGGGDRRADGASLGVAAALVAGFVFLLPELSTTASLRADSLPMAIEVGLRQLGWPLGHPAGAFLIWAPWLVWSLAMIGRRQISVGAGFALVVGLWGGGQAAAIGYARGESALGYVSRYGDFLAIGLVLNAACWAWLWRTSARRTGWRIGLLALGLAWLGLASAGLWHESVTGHTEYNLKRRPAENAANLQRVADYVGTSDPAVLSLERGGATLFTYPPAVQGLLDLPKFRELLPPETRVPEARPDHGRLGWVPVLALWQPGLLAVLAIGLFVVGWRRGAVHLSADRAIADTAGLPDWRTACAVLTGAALALGGLVLAWPQPLLFSASQRLDAALTPEAAQGRAVTGLRFAMGSHHDVDTARMAEAVLSYPLDWRRFATGTALGGGWDTQGTFIGESFTVERDYLVLMHCGFPCSSGNGLRWRLTSPDGATEEWIGYGGPDPGGAWSVWTVNVARHRDWRAELYVFDGRQDERGWLGVMAPVMTDDAAWADGWLARLNLARTEPAHRTLALMAALTGLAALGFWIGSRRRRPKPNALAPHSRTVAKQDHSAVVR